MGLYPTSLNYMGAYSPYAMPFGMSPYNVQYPMFPSALPPFDQWKRNIETGTEGLTQAQADYLLAQKAQQKAQALAQQKAAENMQQMTSAGGSSGVVYQTAKAFEKHNMYKLVTSKEFVEAAKDYSPVAERLESVKNYDDFRFVYNNAKGIQKGLIKRAGTNARISKLLEEAQRRAADANLLLETTSTTAKEYAQVREAAVKANKTVKLLQGRLDNIATMKPEHVNAFKGIKKFTPKSTLKYNKVAKKAGKLERAKAGIKNAGTRVQNGVIHTQNAAARATHKVRCGWFKGNFSKWFGRAAVVAAVAADGYDVYKTADKHGWASKQTVKNVSGKAAGWTGAWAGGKIGAAIGGKVGAAIGALFAGVGAGPGAAVGALIGGIIGSVTGYICAEKTAHKVVDAATQPKTQVA